MEIRILVAAAIALAVAGCSHSTSFDLYVSNETTTTQSLIVTFQKIGSDEAAFKQSWSSIAPNTTLPPVMVRIQPAEYKIQATAGTLKAEQTSGLGTSIVAVSIGIRSNEIIIGVGRT